MDDGKLSRICILDKDKGLLTLAFKVSKSLAAGAEFKLYKAKDQKNYAAWKMACKDNDSVTYILKKRPEELNRHILSWQILLCSLDPKIYEGIVDIIIMQQGKPCKINIPSSREFKNIPPCQIKRTDKCSESLMFIVRTEK